MNVCLPATQGCTILKSKKEGVLAAGTYENAATQAQGIEEGSRSAAGREARAWGRKHGTPLEVGGGGAIREVAGTNQVNCRLSPTQGSTTLQGLFFCLIPRQPSNR
jgi:hypothetical protein